ncbi:YitT family protein [Sporolactobacillus kofuensis]|uniref:YitT family protein n=1 Tax=Sporolactobacillus kofuensis TaxID=269672 RepID=A0ABW1WGV6_9BACL|nr:YitT family protein [Sporolactobacillus kofuensis]MCO7176165.1 YitT family protein [Sporolactobacillus kofuensis]
MKLNLKTKNILFILLGAAIYAFGLVNFNMKNMLAEGGVTGITLILYNLFSIDPAISNIVLNIPLFFAGWRFFRRNEFIYTLIGTFSLSIFLYIFQHWMTFDFSLKHDLFLAALFAGVFIGGGLGIIFRYGGTTGGSDIVARITHKKYGWAMSKTMLIIDAAVIVLSIIYLDYRQMMYTLVGVFVGAKMIDIIQKGAYSAKAIMVFSKKSDQIAEQVIKLLDRSVTLMDGHGGYTGRKMNVLYCVVSSNEVFRLKSLIHEVDPDAFVTVNDVHEVFGEGFAANEIETTDRKTKQISQEKNIHKESSEVLPSKHLSSHSTKKPLQ